MILLERADETVAEDVVAADKRAERDLGQRASPVAATVTPPVEADALEENFTGMAVAIVTAMTIFLFVGTHLMVWGSTGDVGAGIGVGAMAAAWGGPGFGVMAAGAIWSNRQENH